MGSITGDTDVWLKGCEQGLTWIKPSFQWAPERDLRLNALPYRSLQLGLAGDASRLYADEWTVSIRDVTPLARRIYALVRDGELDAAGRLLPEERHTRLGRSSSGS